MRTIGVREFRDKATQMMSSGETLVIERRGEPIGFFVPVETLDRSAGRAALGGFADVLDRVHSATGLTEDEFADEILTDLD